MLSQSGTGYKEINDFNVKFITSKHESVVKNTSFDRRKIDGDDATKKLKEGDNAKQKALDGGD